MHHQPIVFLRPAILLGLATIASACDLAGPCENSPVIEIASTDGSVSAWVFVRDCGATTAKSTQVSILPAGEGPPVDAGNAFVIGGETHVVATWRETSRVSISFEQTGEIFKQEPVVAGVEISYEEN